MSGSFPPLGENRSGGPTAQREIANLIGHRTARASLCLGTALRKSQIRVISVLSAGLLGVGASAEAYPYLDMVARAAATCERVRCLAAAWGDEAGITAYARQ